MSGAVSLLTVEFLFWVQARPRRYAEVKDAWRSTCPMTCAWEDALDAGLVAFESAGERASEARVLLTPRGRAVLAAAARRKTPLDPAQASR